MRSVNGIAAVLGACFLVGCGASLNVTRQERLELRIARDERRAAELRATVLRTAQLQALQQRCLAATECRAKVAAVDAHVARQLASCNASWATWEACDAARTKRTATGAGLGCLLGWGAAAVTGGAAAPLVVAGCGAGALVGNDGAEGSCTETSRPPVCSGMDTVYKGTALRALGLDASPMCEPEPSECGRLNVLLQSL